MTLGDSPPGSLQISPVCLPRQPEGGPTSDPWDSGPRGQGQSPPVSAIKMCRFTLWRSSLNRFHDRRPLKILPIISAINVLPMVGPAHLPQPVLSASSCHNGHVLYRPECYSKAQVSPADSCLPSPPAAQACSRRSGHRRHVWVGNPPFPTVIPAKPPMATAALILAAVAALMAPANVAGVLQRDPPTRAPQAFPVPIPGNRASERGLGADRTGRRGAQTDRLTQQSQASAVEHARIVHVPDR